MVWKYKKNIYHITNDYNMYHMYMEYFQMNSSRDFAEIVCIRCEIFWKFEESND